MTEFTLPPYRLNIDIAATRAYCAAHPFPRVTCGCAGCRNFVRAVKTLPPAVTDFFSALGLDPERAAEVCVDHADKKSCLYGSWYHLVGELTAGEPPPGHLCGAWLTLAEGVEAAFGQECHLLPEDFPRPCLQLNLEWRLPWLLEEKNPYDESFLPDRRNAP